MTAAYDESKTALPISTILLFTLTFYSDPIRGVAKLDYMNPRITASPRRPAGGGAMP